MSLESLVNHPSVFPVMTLRETFHRVFSEGVSWVFTIRGPWAAGWFEYNPSTERISILTEGRCKRAELPKDHSRNVVLRVSREQGGIDD